MMRTNVKCQSSPQGTYSKGPGSHYTLGFLAPLDQYQGRELQCSFTSPSPGSVLSYVHTHTHTHTHTRTYHTHTRNHPHTHTHICTHIYTHMYITHTPSCSQIPCSQPISHLNLSPGLDTQNHIPSLTLVHLIYIQMMLEQQRLGVQTPLHSSKSTYNS